MEEDKKKKKKNNKKKNKLPQTAKPKETVSLHAAGEASTPDPHEHTCEPSSPPRPVSNEQSDGNKVAASQLANGSVQENSAKPKELHSLDKEAVLEEKIKYLLKEKAEMLQKEAAQEDIITLLNHGKNESMLQETHLKEKIVHLEKENNELCHKEGSLEQRTKQLQRENHTHLQKEADLDIKIVQLEGEKDSWLQKEADLDMKIVQLLSEKDLWLQKEAALEEKITHLVDEAAVLNLKGVSFEETIKQMERERDSWILRENSAKESISIQDSENFKLRAQVIDLEQLSKSLIEEKQQLEEKISSLEMQISNLERTVRAPNPSEGNKGTCEDGEPTHQIEVARALVEKLMIENSQLVEKMNELYVELDQRGKRQEDSLSISALGLPLNVKSADSSSLPADKAVRDVNRTAAADTLLEVSKVMLSSSSGISLEDVMIEDQRNSEQHLNDKGALELANTSEIIEVDEIVQIPLHDQNEIAGINLKEAENNDEKSDIPLTDAPLIGAPFRLISFVARYVSGADLVK